MRLKFINKNSPLFTKLAAAPRKKAPPAPTPRLVVPVTQSNPTTETIVIEEVTTPDKGKRLYLILNLI